MTRQVVRWLLPGLGVISVILPMLWTALASLKVQANNNVSPPIWSLPPSFDSYLEIRSEQTFFWQELAASTLLSALTMLLTISLAFLAAYSLARTRARWRRLAAQSCLILASLPIISFVFPLGDILRYLRLHDTFVGMVLAESAVFAPLAVYILYGYLRRLPKELEEAAIMDGATLLQVLRQAVLPAIASGVVATAVIVFTLSWNQFFLPLVLTGIRIRVIPVMMRDFFSLEREFDWTVASAVLILSLLPVSVVAGTAHRMLERFGLVSLVDVD
jgi:ABC-type glycerol-3-phosphate transport system permease component